MKEFCYLGYCTEYSCEGDLEKGMSKEACFSYVFNNVRSKHSVTYNVYVYEGVERARDGHQSNACLLTINQVRRHLDKLKSLYPVEVKVRREKEENRLLVTLKIEKAPATFHKYALTWLRYTYEYPYNVLLRDAYELRKDPQFRFESIANIFNLTVGCFCHNPRDIHQVPNNVVTERLTISQVREKIRKVNRLNYIYKKVKDKKLQVPEKINGHGTEDLEYWDEGFEKRKAVYMDVRKANKR